MKKTISIIMLLIIMISFYCVNAKNNVLYFVKQGNKLVYESDIEENIFMQHLDMIPGSSYTDELEIENGTNTSYKLYLKVNEIEQNETADKLLDSIDMKVYLDEELIYDGKAKGIDYSNNGINLQNAIFLKEFESNDKSLLKAEVKLSEEYSNKNSVLSKINWEFYAQYENEQPQIIENVPKTDVNNNTMVIMSIIVLILGIVFVIFSQIKKTKKNKNTSKKVIRKNA